MGGAYEGLNYYLLYLHFALRTGKGPGERCLLIMRIINSSAVSACGLGRGLHFVDFGLWGWELRFGRACFSASGYS